MKMKTDLLSLRSIAICVFTLTLLYCGHSNGQIITTVAGTGTSPSYGVTDTNTIATATNLSPNFIAVDNSGNIYICEPSNYRVRKINTLGIVSTVAGTGVYGYSGDGGAATAAKFNYPQGIAVDGSGNLYICDGNNYRIRKVNSSGIISTIVGTGVWGSTGDGGAATAAGIGVVSTITADASGNIYFYDGGSYKVRKINTSGIITSIAGNGTQGYTGDGGAATAAQIGSNIFLTTDLSGNIYLADANNNCVRKVNTSGIITTVAGTGGGGAFTGDGGAATAAKLNYPSAIAVDAAGNLYIQDYSNVRIRKVNTSGIISTYAGTGTYGYSGENIPATSAPLQYDMSIAVDGSRNVYTAGTAGNRVRKITCAPVVAPITGASTLCASGTITLADTTTGGAWTSTAGTVAAISSSGVVTAGATAGTTTISYAVTNSCTTAAATKSITVNAAPVVAAISGTSTVCTGSSTSFTDATTGGAWTSSTSTTASVSSTGVVTGVAAGSATISYSVTNICGTTRATKNITVSATGGSVAAITGPSSVCAGTTYTFTDATTSGTWNTSSSSIATVNSSGVVTGVAAGSVTLSYSVTGCGTTTVTKALTINPAPTIGATTGASSIVAGSSTTLTNASGSGWTSSVVSVATVSATGVVLGVSAGTTTISCNSSNACGTVYSTFVMTVTAAATGSTYVISTAVGTGVSGFSGDGGAATSAQLSYPYAVAVDASGNRYIADQVNNRIRKINAAGVITTIAGTGVAGYSGDGGAATAAKLNLPTGVTVDASGNVYITDHSNNRIRKINTSGIISTVAGSGTGLDGVAATAASLYNPTSVSVDASGNMYITETGNHCVRKVNTSGVISRFAGSGSVGYTGDGAAATAAALSSPVGIYCDASGNVYISDLGNHSVRKVTSTGVITTVAGTGTAGYSNDGGAATAARINNPYNITMDASGNMYICDYGNYAIRKVTSGGIISTIAGNGTIGYSGDGGAATLATLNAPTGIAVDATGNIYIADINNHRLRKLAIGCPLPLPGTLSGPTAVAVGGNIALFTIGTGGVWSSTNTARATVSAAGLAHGVATGVDTIKYTVTNSCGSASAIYVINVTGSKTADATTEEIAQSATTLKVYPNPSTGMLNIEAGQDQLISTVVVFDLTGKMLQQQAGTGNTAQLNISGYAAGVYILNVQYADGALKQMKVIKD